MSKRLDKAKAALDEAKSQDRNAELQTHLLDIAKTQAAIAGAEALEALLDRWPSAPFTPVVDTGAVTGGILRR